MKLLERISLLQFFLYEREDLDVARNTGFLGPNGTGKTCLLDAVQMVMLGADQSRMHFNAQADGKRRDRSLRAYCLGLVDEDRCRDLATTYVSLVFRDEQSGAVVTAGVGLTASVEREDATFQGLFILPGVALSTGDLVELVDGTERIVPWRDAQYRFKELVDQGGTGLPALITQNRDEFVRKLLLEHLAAPGDKPNPSMFRNAFPRSLQLKVIEELSSALRNDLIEAHPTNIREFRFRVDQFRQMRDLVRRIKEQITSVARVRELYERVRSFRVRASNYDVLATSLEVEAMGEQAGDKEQEVEELAAAIKRASAELERANAAYDAATEAHNAARDARARDPAYQERVQSTQIVDERARNLERARQGLEKELATMARDAQAVGQLEALSADRPTFDRAVASITAILQAVREGLIPEAQELQALAATLARAATCANARAATLEAMQQDLDRDLALARTARERAAKGLAPLAPPVEQLLAHLTANGIAATPVCDLVEVAEPEWQRAIEAYLGLNTQALLVAREDEERAVRAYRVLRNEGVYGAKLATPSRSRPWRAEGDERAIKYAATLIRSANQDALAFLRGELGQVECVETERELLTRRRAITSDGMVAAGGSVDRRRLGADLKIGRQDTARAGQLAEEALRLAQTKCEAGRRVLLPLRSVLTGLLPFAAPDPLAGRLNSIVVDIDRQQRLLADAREHVVTATSAELDRLETRVQETQAAATTADGARLRWNQEHARDTALHGTATRELTEIGIRHTEAIERERRAREQPLYDPNEVERLRAKLEGETEIDPKDYQETCRYRQSENERRAGNSADEATDLYSRYILEFGVNADVAADWSARAAFAEQEHTRLSTLTLAEKENEAEQAFRAAERVFRTDVVQSLTTGFDRIVEQIKALNLVLKKAPEFSNRERFHFRYEVVDQHRALYNFLDSVRRADTTDDALWSSPEALPPEFRELLEPSEGTALLSEASPLYDYRRFFAFDVEIRRDGAKIGLLSKRFGPGSGGEHRTPLYVIFGASLAAAYGNLHGENQGGGLMLLDEAFDKMDATNMRAAADYLNKLGLQLLLAGPETDQSKLSGILDRYYDMARHGTRTIRLERYEVTAATRELLASDNPIYHPELLEVEIERLRGEAKVRDVRPVDA